MSEGITFSDPKEAREYQKRLIQTEQVASKIKREDDGYVVIPIKGEKPIEMSFVPKDEFTGVLEGATGVHLVDEGKHKIYLKEGEGKSRLHELGHAKLEHKNRAGETFEDLVDKELDADIFTWQARDKELNARVGWNAVRQAIHESDMNPVSVVNMVARKLEDRGIKVTKEDKQWFIDTTMAKTDDEKIEEWKQQMKEQF